MVRAVYILAGIALATSAAPSHAQVFSRADLGVIAHVEYVACPSVQRSPDADRDKAKAELGLPLATFAAQVAGDATAAAANALGAALLEASRSRTFAATGQSSFEFYQVQTNDEGPRLAPAFGPSGQCLVIRVPSATLPNRDALYIEAQLEGRPDGFLIRPLVVHYNEALEGAPRSNALPAELHLTFATPGTRTAESEIGSVFAVARIPLPAFVPGRSPFGLRNPRREEPTAARPSDWAGYASIVLPPRPTTGTPNDFLAALTTAETQRIAQAQLVLGLRRALVAAERASVPTDAATQRAVEQAQLALDDGTELLQTATLRVTAIAALRGGLFGSTNVQARFVLVRNENGFLKAIGKSLQDRSATLGTAVGTALTPEGPAAAWTTADTSYVTAMNEVLTKEAALAAAVVGGEAAAILTARIALINAQAGANAAAAASGRDLPYPGIV